MKKYSLISIVILSIISLTLIASCRPSEDKENILAKEFAEIYRSDIQAKLAKFDFYRERNLEKCRVQFLRAQQLQNKFDTIYSLVEKSDSEGISVMLHDIQTIVDAMTNSVGQNSKLSNLLQTKLSAKNRAIYEMALLNLNSELLSDLIHDVGANDFHVNKMTAIVVPLKNEVNLGEEFEAQIYLAAVDTTILPTIEIGKEKSYITGRGYGTVKIKPQKKGINVLKGSIFQHDEKTGLIMQFPFEKTYNVK